MEIGTKISVFAVAEPYYETYYYKSYRKIGRRFLDLTKVFYAYYVGYTYKHEGQYEPGTVKTIWISGSYEPEPPMLINRIYHLVYRIRFHERGREHYCFPKDCRIIQNPED